MQIANSQKAMLAYSFFIALCSLLIVSVMFLSPSEAESSIIFGLSLSRLMLVLGFLAVFVFFVTLCLKALKDAKWAESSLEHWFGGGRFGRTFAWLAGIGLGLAWIGTFLPSYRAGFLVPHWNRIQPIMIFILVTSMATLVVFILKRTNFSFKVIETPDILRFGIILFLATLPFLALTISSKYDAYRLEDFWYGAGVPVLPSQLIMALLGGVFLLMFWRRPQAARSDLAVIIVLYVVTAILWAREPLQKSFLFIGPHAPNKVLYPFADAATFDMASQFGLIGQGIYIFNTPFFERTLYISFLIYLHSLFGQDYETLMDVQAVIFAVFPVLIYLIGRSLNMRAVGLTAAILAIMRGANSIAASNLTDLANPKMIMTDFPTAIAVALLVLLACGWLKDPEKKWSYALWVGGAIGFTLMLRINALMFLPFIPLYVIFRFLPRWKNWLLACSLMVFAVIAITLPWELRNVSRGALPYSPILTKIQQVLRMRYPAPSSSLLPTEKTASAGMFQNTQVLSRVLYNNQVQACQTVACFAPKHFLHDVITSILLLPTSPVLDDLRHTVKESNPYWRQGWNGHLEPSALLFFALNIFFISLGISVAWKRRHLQGLAPLAIFMFYNLSNAFARTSGGRYIVPIDWIMSLYFVIGVLFLVNEIAQTTDFRVHSFFDPEAQEVSPSSHQSHLITAVSILLVLFIAGSLVPLSEKLYPERYANFNFSEALQQWETQIADAGLTRGAINTFLKNPDAEMLVGRTLYPRAYKMGQGEFYFSPYTVMEFPRTAFILIGPHGGDGVILPGGFPKYFPHASDALVIGCKGETYTDALAVILLDGSGKVYVRSPKSELTCPLKQPVCDNNTVCK